jgi:ABC transporter DrrB family efflux protein
MPGLAGTFHDGWVVTLRNLRRMTRIPEMVVFATIQPIMFVLLFSFVFGGAIPVSGGGGVQAYREYLLPGIFTQTLAFTTGTTAVGLADDLHKGLVDRFRSLPMARSAYLLGQIAAELMAVTIAITVMVVTGLIIGWRIHSSVGTAIGGFALLGLLGITMVWLGTLIGTVARSPDVVTGIAFMVVFPLTFVASTFVPLAGLPAGLRDFAEYNPVSIFAAAVRTLFGNPTATPAHAGWLLAHPVLGAVLWCVVLLAVAVPVTLRVYRRRTTG